MPALTSGSRRIARVSRRIDREAEGSARARAAKQQEIGLAPRASLFSPPRLQEGNDPARLGRPARSASLARNWIGSQTRLSDVATVASGLAMQMRAAAQADARKLTCGTAGKVQVARLPPAQAFVRARTTAQLRGERVSKKQFRTRLAAHESRNETRRRTPKFARARAPNPRAFAFRRAAAERACAGWSCRRPRSFLRGI